MANYKFIATILYLIIEAMLRNELGSNSKFS